MYFILILVASAAWVGYDTSNLGVKKGCLGGGFFDMGPMGWVFAVMLFWIVAFPVYFAKRGEYKRLSVLAAKAS